MRVCVCMCVYMCVEERERERERKSCSHMRVIFWGFFLPCVRCNFFVFDDGSRSDADSKQKQKQGKHKSHSMCTFEPLTKCHQFVTSVTRIGFFWVFFSKTDICTVHKMSQFRICDFGHTLCFFLSFFSKTVSVTFLSHMSRMVTIQMWLAPMQMWLAPIQRWLAPIQRWLAPIQRWLAPIQMWLAPIQMWLAQICFCFCFRRKWFRRRRYLQNSATHCNTLQHTAPHCNTLQHTAPHYNTLQHTATHCNTLQHTKEKIPAKHTRKWALSLFSVFCLESGSERLWVLIVLQGALKSWDVLSL